MPFLVMTHEEKIALLEGQLRSVLEAYETLEEYTCELLGSDAEVNETITHCNAIVTIAMSVEND
jgi:hypothetical protein